MATDWQQAKERIFFSPVVSENSTTTEIAETQPVAGFAKSQFRIVDLRLASDGRDDSIFWTLRDGLPLHVDSLVGLALALLLTGAFSSMQ